jgi:tripartite-type tricarboxylate transporter receptor subunit TctC
MKQALMHTLLALATAGASAGASAQAASQKPAYPTKPIRIVVPFTPGSATDIIARIVGPKLAERWGRPVVIDNRPSAGGVVACTIVVEETADGGAGSARLGAWMRPGSGL